MWSRDGASRERDELRSITTSSSKQRGVMGLGLYYQQLVLIDFVVCKDCNVGFVIAFESEIRDEEMILIVGETELRNYCTFVGYLSKTEETNMYNHYYEMEQLKHPCV